MVKLTTLMQALTGSTVVPELIARFRRGDRAAADRLFEILYPELRRLAAAKMRREREGHTWQPTILVNELYLELLKVKALSGPENQQEKAAFMGFAGYLMNRLLARHSRPLAKKAVKVEADEDVALDSAGAETLAHVETMLARLEAIDPKFRKVIELRVFEGQTMEEIAQQLGCSRKSVDRYWSFASHCLRQELASRES